MHPTWLPAMLNMDGIWENNLKTLYSIFQMDFIQNPPVIDECKVHYDSRILEGIYPEGFWHVITRKDQKTGERYPDFPRAARLPWCGPSLNNSDDPIIYKWEIEERKEIRTYVWLVNYDYVVVVKKHNTLNIGYLITAYHVDGDRSKKKLMNSYINRIC